MRYEYPAANDDLEHDQSSHTPQFGLRKIGHRKRWLWWLAGAVVVLALAAGAWLLLGKKPAPAKVNHPKTTQQQQPVGRQPQANATTQTFKSTKLNLAFNYRSDWTVREADNKDEIIITSPQVTYASKDGVSKEGVFTLKIRNGTATQAMQTTVQNAVAVRDSEVVAYDQPTDAQRHYTNVTYGGPDAKDFSFFIITGSTGVKAGSSFAYQINIADAYLFAGGYGTDDGDALAFEPVPLSAYDTDALQQAIAIVKSLKIY